MGTGRISQRKPKDLRWGFCDVPDTEQWGGEAPSLRDSGAVEEAAQNLEPAQVLEDLCCLKWYNASLEKEFIPAVVTKISDFL
ncbi:hypothetical protein WISP_27411 [Willisornis vidua]|uniref:Uncharacterized protein n=1 Tax=Willisornis vidua TaxID=1566151 RepID=A0ABQ9DLF0_9PASS|nr:hypothetical protein WISP_27411 [Willisornis vidua]